MSDSRPELIGDDMVEFTNGVRLTRGACKRLRRGVSWRRLAGDLGVSYLELTDAVALFKDGEHFDPPQWMLNEEQAQ